MADKKFNYGKAEADLYDSGCPDSEEIYSYRSEKGIKEFMQENGLNPDKYYEEIKDSHSSESNNGNASGCYLTSACVYAKGMPDDCDDLTVLRNYRDTFLVNRDGGTKDIAYYYKTAPEIVTAINAQPNAKVLWEGVYEQLVKPCVTLIKQGNLEQAYAAYRDYTLKLAEKYM